MRWVRSYQPNNTAVRHLSSNTVVYDYRLAIHVMLRSVLVWIQSLRTVAHLEVLIKEELCKFYRLTAVSLFSSLRSNYSDPLFFSLLSSDKASSAKF